MGLILDTPKQGFGNTNDGNTARRFFDYPEITSSITGVNKEIIENFKIILNVIACTLPINGDKFGIFARTTEEQLETFYPWRKLTPTVHKVLRHGKHIILCNILPIGELSEEAQESKNKEYKYFRYHNTRKTSRLDQNKDLLSKLLISSDPLISSFRHVMTKKEKLKQFPEKMAKLLDIDPDLNEILSPLAN